tara:strand:+ start:3598 stop:3915 length:318 start_codon:yes stop_codon:yes gene_type:complete
MFDLYCAHCGEPWEHDMLHEIPNLDYMDAAVSFKLMGCLVFQPLRQKIYGKGSVCKAERVVSDDELAGINAAHEMSEYPEEWDYDMARDIFTGEFNIKDIFGGPR